MADKRLRSSLFSLILAGLAGAVSATPLPARPDASGVITLGDGWLVRPGDDRTWALPDYDDSGWSGVHVPVGWGAQPYSGAPQAFSWYRITLDLGAYPRGEPKGVALGKIDAAYQLYAGGRLLGGVGELPPGGRIEYDRHGTYALPEAAIAPDGRLVLAVRVWTSPDAGTGKGGLVEGPFRLGPIDELERRSVRSNAADIALTVLFVGVGISQLLMYFDRRHLRDYLWFGLLSLNAGGYTFALGQWKYALFPHGFLWMKELEYAFLYAFAASFIQFAWPILQQPIGPWVRAYQWLSLTAALFASLTPGLYWNNRILPFWESGFVAAMPFLGFLLAREIRKGNRDARALGLGLAVFMAACLHDVLLDRGLITTPRMTPFGFGGLVVAMAAALSQRFTRLYAEVEGLRQDLERRVTARTQELTQRSAELHAANQQLAEQAESLGEANQAKNRFLLKMSHEVRTPLNGVLGMARLLMAMRLTPEQRECAQDIHGSGTSLLGIVNDVLDFVRVATRNVGLQDGDFAPRALVEEEVGAARPTAQAKGLRIDAEIAGDVPQRLRGDGGRLRQVLHNLIDNAVKFTLKGAVTLRVTREQARNPADPPGIRFSVEDTGPGVPPALRPELFEPFAQGDESLARRHGGTGLGLAMARELARLMGGDVGFESRAGGGSTFWVGVPLRPAEPAPGEAPHEPAVDPLTVARDDVPDGDVLIVEDNPINQRVAALIVTKLGYRAEVAASGAEAVDAANRRTYDAILMDLQMPEMDGFEATARIRRGGPCQNAPIIALTASVSREDRDRCIERGMNDHLGKPASPEQIEEMLAKWIGRRRWLRSEERGAARE